MFKASEDSTCIKLYAFPVAVFPFLVFVYCPRGLILYIVESFWSSVRCFSLRTSQNFTNQNYKFSLFYMWSSSLTDIICVSWFSAPGFFYKILHRAEHYCKTDVHVSLYLFNKVIILIQFKLYYKRVCLCLIRFITVVYRNHKLRPSKSLF